MLQGRHNSKLVELNGSSVRTRWLLVGACGAGMQSFARILEIAQADADHEMLGTDVDSEQLEKVAAGFDRMTAVPWTDDWQAILNPDFHVVHSVAVPAEARILQDARQKNCRVLSLPEALAQIAANRDQICVSGTHGKTTTTGLVSWILQAENCEAFHFIGGEFCSAPERRPLKVDSSPAQRNWAVIEGCEYRNSFLGLSPQVAILTGIEPDHFDFFKSPQDQLKSFAQFLNRCHPEGTIVANADCQTSMALARESGRSFVTFSATSLNADWSLLPTQGPLTTSSRPPFRQKAELFRNGQSVSECVLPIPGRHNRQNWLAALVGAFTCGGVELNRAIAAAATFPGMRRRFEYRGDWRQILWIDDYAHHPTAIRETLTTARSIFPSSRLVVVVEPHQISRTEQLFSEYVHSLAAADEALILPVLPARENATLAVCQELSGRLVRKVSESGGRAMLAANLDQVLGRLDHSARPGDVVITMGAGRTHTIHDEIHRRLQRNSAA